MIGSDLISRLFYLLVFCCALCGGASATEAKPFVPSPHAIDIPRWFSESFLDLRDDVQDAARQQRRLLIYFGQDGCPYCKALMQVTFRQPDIAAKTRQYFLPVALNLWGDREVTWLDGRRMSEKELGAVLKVQFTPTLLFFDEQGKVVLRLNGYSPPEKFRVALDYVGLRLDKKQSFTDYLAATAAIAPGAQLANETFFTPGPADMPRLIKAAAKPVIVVFEQPSCRECDELHRVAFQRAEIRQLLDRFTVVQAALAGERKVVTPGGMQMSERDWARALKVVYAPSMVFFDAAGGEVFRAEGYLRPFHIASALDYVGSGAYRDQPSFQRFVQKRADEMRAAGKQVELWN